MNPLANILPCTVLLCGPQGTGKSTLAAELALYGFKRHSFAAPLKSAVQTMYGVPDEVLYGPSTLRNVPLRAVATRMPTLLDCSRWLDSVPGGCKSVFGMTTNHAMFQFLPELFTISSTADCTVREVLQRIGTAGRAMNPDCWAALGVAMASADTHVVFDDARYPSELESVTCAACKWLAVGMVGTGTPPPAGSHASETEAWSLANSADMDVKLSFDTHTSLGAALYIMQVLECGPDDATRPTDPA